MGKVVASLCKNYSVEVAAGVDAFANPEGFTFPVYKTFKECKIIADVIIDFSRPEALDDILNFAKDNSVNIVLATTGYTDAERARISEVAKSVAIFQTYNYSLGINLLAKLCNEAARKLGSNYDIEIIEKHHNQKVDAPSGTAILLGEAINNGRDENFVFGRSGKDAKRKAGEIGFSSVRGGNIVGEHDVMFIGNNEIITLSHSAASRDVFAEGAIRAAMFLKGRCAGKYDMKDVIQNG